MCAFHQSQSDYARQTATAREAGAQARRPEPYHLPIGMGQLMVICRGGYITSNAPVQPGAGATAVVTAYFDAPGMNAGTERRRSGHRCSPRRRGIAPAVSRRIGRLVRHGTAPPFVEGPRRSPSATMPAVRHHARTNQYLIVLCQ